MISLYSYISCFSFTASRAGKQLQNVLIHKLQINYIHLSTWIFLDFMPIFWRWFTTYTYYIFVSNDSSIYKISHILIVFYHIHCWKFLPSLFFLPLQLFRSSWHGVVVPATKTPMVILSSIWCTCHSNCHCCCWTEQNWNLHDYNCHSHLPNWFEPSGWNE